MKQNQTYQKDIESIRQLMERSVKFLSLSGLSGILAGIYAMIGAGIAYAILYNPKTPFEYRNQAVKEITIILKLASDELKASISHSNCVVPIIVLLPVILLSGDLKKRSSIRKNCASPQLKVEKTPSF